MARRQLSERIFVSAVFAFTMGFVAMPSFGVAGSIGIGAAAFLTGTALAVLRHSSAQRSMESDFDSLRHVAAESGTAPTPEERLEAFDSIRFLSGDVVETTRDSQPEELPSRTGSE